MSGQHADPRDAARHRRLARWLSVGAGMVALLAVSAIVAVVIAGSGPPSVLGGGTLPRASGGVPSPPSWSPTPSGSATSPAPSASATASAGRPSSSPPARPPTHRPTAGPVRTVSTPTTAEAQVLDLVNKERAKAGCKALRANSRLASAARGHSTDMARRDYFDHDTPEGTGPGDRITAAGYQWSGWGENIAMGQRDADAVMRAWMNSPGHRKNILNCAYRDIGVGLAYNSDHTPYWTQDFGTPR